MNRTIRTGDGSRLAAWAVIVLSAALVCSPVVAAGWQSGADATAGFGTDVEAAELDHDDSGSAKRDDGTDGSHDGNETGEPDGSTEQVEPDQETASTSTAEHGTGDLEPRSRETSTDAIDRTRPENGTDRLTDEGNVLTRCSAIDGNEDENGTGEGRGGGHSPASGRSSDGYATLRSDLWIVGALTGLTTLFSLGGFVAALMAYRGTD